MKTVVSFGEIMLRLKSPAIERFFQSPWLETNFGGAEANVMISLAQFGHTARYVSAIPDGPLGDAALRSLRAQAVDTQRILRAPGRLGLYFLEAGSNQRPSQVIYDRQDSLISLTDPSAYDWPAILSGADWLHLSGITPAISEPAAAAVFAAARCAAGLGIGISLDLNFRKKLWNWGKSAVTVMSELAAFATVITANEDDIQNCLGLSATVTSPDALDFDPQSYRGLCQKVIAAYPKLQMLAITLRQSHSAERNGWSAAMQTRSEWLVSRNYDIQDIADRVGGGDAFSAGLIHGILTKLTPSAALEFATAASCLKHSIPGDFNQVNAAEVQALVGGDDTGRIKR